MRWNRCLDDALDEFINGYSTTRFQLQQPIDYMTKLTGFELYLYKQANKKILNWPSLSETIAGPNINQSYTAFKLFRNMKSIAFQLD